MNKKMKLHPYKLESRIMGRSITQLVLVQITLFEEYGKQLMIHLSGFDSFA